MNLRMSKNCFRFRITPEDLDNLLLGHDVDQRVCIDSRCFTYRISPAVSGKELKMEITADGFRLSASRETLEKLRDLGRSKNGISVTQGEVEISLQVDIKTQTRKAA